MGTHESRDCSILLAGEITCCAVSSSLRGSSPRGAVSVRHHW